jgi:hypothetical protein
MRGLHDLGILGFIGNTQRQIVLLDRDKLAGLDLQVLNSVPRGAIEPRYSMQPPFAAQ